MLEDLNRAEVLTIAAIVQDAQFLDEVTRWNHGFTTLVSRRRLVETIWNMCLGFGLEDEWVWSCFFLTIEAFVVCRLFLRIITVDNSPRLFGYVSIYLSMFSISIHFYRTIYHSYSYLGVLCASKIGLFGVISFLYPHLMYIIYTYDICFYNMFKIIFYIHTPSLATLASWEGPHACEIPHNLPSFSSDFWTIESIMSSDKSI